MFSPYFLQTMTPDPLSARPLIRAAGKHSSTKPIRYALGLVAPSRWTMIAPVTPLWERTDSAVPPPRRQLPSASTSPGSAIHFKVMQNRAFSRGGGLSKWTPRTMASGCLPCLPHPSYRSTIPGYSSCRSPNSPWPIPYVPPCLWPETTSAMYPGHCTQWLTWHSCAQCARSGLPHSEIPFAFS